MRPVLLPFIVHTDSFTAYNNTNNNNNYNNSDDDDHNNDNGNDNDNNNKIYRAPFPNVQ